ncbi:hypothetical protein F4553_005950 [Allocatelliglobosispora scoriae]|uniref:TolB n=1 Tax=Allocatelliglobosispora scoriae TaxID=643052 RepID=A0A841BY91_9ACTN|nr:hypothetical protein [Allocatelliglobosispora scoriae]MBB5872516.1 hypothetical protein [Allocatelliglobosispora scoriae]
MKRALILATATVTLAAIAIAYSVLAAAADPAGPGTALDTARPGRLLFRDESGRVASVAATDPGGPRQVSDTSCQRFHAAAGTAVCLISEVRSGLPATSALILDHDLHETRRIQLAGIPSRARVSASGRMVSWTVFVTGDSYNVGGFSTWTGILDTRTGYPIINMENIQLYLDGKRYHAADVNYWGVTFGADDNLFYATVATRGRTYLVQGDYARWEARVLRADVECPSLSPDGTRLAFKKRSSPTTWRLHVLELATMRETALAETASVDDQALWLSNTAVAYARGGGVWSVPADGTGTPSLLIPHAGSLTVSG